MTSDQDNPMAYVSNRTMTHLWGLAADAINQFKADGLEEAATELRATADELGVDGLHTAALILGEKAERLRNGQNGKQQ